MTTLADIATLFSKTVEELATLKAENAKLKEEIDSLKNTSKIDTSQHKIVKMPEYESNSCLKPLCSCGYYHCKFDLVPHYLSETLWQSSNSELFLCQGVKTSDSEQIWGYYAYDMGDFTMRFFTMDFQKNGWTMIKRYNMVNVV